MDQEKFTEVRDRRVYLTKLDLLSEPVLTPHIKNIRNVVHHFITTSVLRRKNLA